MSGKVVASFEFDAPFFNRKGVKTRLIEATREVDLWLEENESLLSTTFRVDLIGQRSTVEGLLDHPHVKPLTRGGVTMTAT